MIKKLMKILIFFVILIIVVLLYGRFFGTKGLKTKEVVIYSDSINQDFDGIKVVHFSDLHYKRIITKKDIEKIVDEINLINPDIVLFTGDLIDDDSKINDDDINYLISILSKIDAKYGKYSIVGNHDYSIDIETLRYIYDKSNFNLLEDTYDIIYSKNNNKLFIGGISTGSYNEDTLSYLNYDEDIYKIIIFHEPDFVNKIININPDLLLAGHSHNGQINIPVIKKVFLPKNATKYYDEYYQVNGIPFYISSGIGVSRYNIRINNKPSINFYRINKK